MALCENRLFNAATREPLEPIRDRQSLAMTSQLLQQQQRSENQGGETTYRKFENRKRRLNLERDDERLMLKNDNLIGCENFSALFHRCQLSGDSNGKIARDLNEITKMNY